MHDYVLYRQRVTLRPIVEEDRELRQQKLSRIFIPGG